ncbi:MAG: cysteine--tRNA ligase [Actinomycetota bacterium]
MLRLRNTLTKQVEEITPLEPGHIGMYSCGPTVYRPLHVGNLRSFLLSDVIDRVLSYHGLDVRRVMNITDVGHMTDELTDEGRDRMLMAMEDEGLGTSEIAEKYTDIFYRDTDAVNIRRAAVYPKATEHIEQIKELIAKLLERGHAYSSDGTIYYDVTSFADYGKLSGQSLDAMQPGHRIEIDTRKRNHQDFTLWVAAGPRRELVFDSPWGTGYPGWHIECSAMSLHYLGERFDIHTGGVDNRFPHHEDEIAQSEGAVGHRVVQTWSHGEHLLMAQLKMAKSAGNVVTVQSLIDAGVDPLAFRYLCFTGRYRRQVHFTQDALDAAATALRRLREQVALLGVAGSAVSTDPDLRADLRDGAVAYHDRFIGAIDDDLDLPAAVTVLHETLADDSIPPTDRRSLVGSWDEILGLDLIGSDELPPELAQLVRRRDEARAARDFAGADEIRDRLRAQGVELLDSDKGTRWVRR